MADFITELRERRVLPAVGVYVASCWVVVEILDRLVERYLLSPYLTDIVFWGLYSLLPAVALVAWSYGRPGKDKATRAQKIGVPINLLATAGLLFTLFGGKDLGATAEVVSVVNEEGQQETHIVPEASYRRRLAVYFYENESDDPALDWLQYAAAEVLTQDLQQDPYLDASSPYSAWASGVYQRLKAAGFEDGVGAPAALLRDLSRDANIRYFTEGSIRRENGELVLETRLWETESMARVAELTERGMDILALQDATSVRVREALEVPSMSMSGYEDLPLVETYGESGDALRAYVEGLNARLLDNDVVAGIAAMDVALEADPRAVLALFVKGLLLQELGDMPAAAEVLAEAQRLDYRLPATDRALLKAELYQTSGQTGKLREFVRLQVRLTDNAYWHAQLAGLLMLDGKTEEARDQFEMALERDALFTELHLTLSDIERSLGDMDAAIGHAERYQEARPTDIAAGIKLGDLLRDTGDLEGAQGYYEQAQLLEGDTITPILRQHLIAARQGDDARARGLLEEAAAVARTASQQAQVHQYAAYHEMRNGRLGKAIEQWRASEPYMAEAQPPFVVAITVYSAIVSLAIERDDLDLAKATFEEAQAIVSQPPMNQFLEAMAALIATYEGDFAAAQGHLATFSALLENLGFSSLTFQVPMFESEIAYRQGDYAEAARLIEASLEQIDQSFLAGEMYHHTVPMVLGDLANLQVMAGKLESAESTLRRAEALDPSLPSLWLARARLQNERGQTELARASVSEALAAWEDADPMVHELQVARELASDIGAGGP